MKLEYLAIDKNIELHHSESTEWKKSGIFSVRVDSMDEGIVKAAKSNFLFIAINADNIEYMDKLKILRSVTDDPILIATSNYTLHEYSQALTNGADAFGLIEDAKTNKEAALAIVYKATKQAARQKVQTEIISYGDILIIPDYHMVYISDEEKEFTKIELLALSCLLSESERIFTTEEIYAYVYKGESEENPYHAVKSLIKRLRKKIGENYVIKKIRGVGYKLIINV